MLIDYPNKICGISIETDFKYWLKYVARIIDSRILHPQEKVAIILYNLFVDFKDEDVIKLFEETMKFYNSGKEDRGLTPPNEPLIHWEKDINTIRADFLLYYKIDINIEDTKMHWWEFQSLFNSLPPDSKIKKIGRAHV